MKNFLALFLVVCLSGLASAGPYFRFVDPAHPQPVVGAFYSPSDGSAETGSLLPIITHSPKDGCSIPSIVCEDWSPLALGFNKSGSAYVIDVAGGLDLVPLIQKFGTGLLDLVSGPAFAPGLRAILTPTVPGQEVDVRLSIWPSYRQGLSFKKAGVFRIFIGPQIFF